MSMGSLPSIPVDIRAFAVGATACSLIGGVAVARYPALSSLHFQSLWFVLILAFALYVVKDTLIEMKKGQKRWENNGGVCPLRVCALRIPGSFDFSTLKGDHYYFKKNGENVASCAVTAWNLLHVLMGAYFGYFTPDLFWPFVVATTYWEVLEAQVGCHDLLDPAWNILGFVAGCGARVCLARLGRRND